MNQCPPRDHRGSHRWRVARGGALALVLLAFLAAAPPAPQLELEFIGEARLAPDTTFADTVVGGLSGLAYDPRSGLYLAVSDDKGEHGPARFYTLAVNLDDGSLHPDGVLVLEMTPLYREDGSALPPGDVDLEGIALAPDGSLLLSSEGALDTLAPPYLLRVARDGRILGDLPVPAYYLPAAGSGIRRNKAFESLSVTPDGATVVTALENALLQDGPAADFATTSPARILLLDRATGRPRGEYVYRVEKVPRPAVPVDGCPDNGLSDLLALSDHRFIALERGFVPGVGSCVRLYEVNLDDATDVEGVPNLHSLPSNALRPVTKRLLLDLGTLGIPIDNPEGLALGPTLPDGRRALVVVSDDNFDSAHQFTQLLAFAVRGLEPAAATGCRAARGTDRAS